MAALPPDGGRRKSRAGSDKDLNSVMSSLLAQTWLTKTCDGSAAAPLLAIVGAASSGLAGTTERPVLKQSSGPARKYCNARLMLGCRPLRRKLERRRMPQGGRGSGTASGASRQQTRSPGSVTHPAEAGARQAHSITALRAVVAINSAQDRCEAPPPMDCNDAGARGAGARGLAQGQLAEEAKLWASAAVNSQVLAP